MDAYFAALLKLAAASGALPLLAPGVRALLASRAEKASETALGSLISLDEEEATAALTAAVDLPLTKPLRDQLEGTATFRKVGHTVTRHRVLAVAAVGHSLDRATMATLLGDDETPVRAAACRVCRSRR